MVKKMKEWFFYILGNGIVLWLTYEAVFNGVIGAERILFFLVMLLFVGSIVFCVSEEIQQKRLEKGRTAHFLVDMAIDVTMIVVLLWHGFFITGVLYFLHYLIGEGTWESLQKDKNHLTPTE